MKSAVHKKHTALIAAFLLLILSSAGYGVSLSDSEILRLQASLKGRPAGERIAAVAERFVGTPYDPDPLGAYVTRAAIVADDRVDCMYLVFRAVELALGSTPDEAVQIALDRRFHSRGVLENGRIVNYENRFAYGEDMIESGKWGREITGEIGRTVRIKDRRRGVPADILPAKELLRGMGRLQSGDILFLIKGPGRTAGDEIVGHMGIIKRDGDGVISLIHASGRKGTGGVVRKILLRDYILRMPFIGAKITRFP